MGTLLYIQASPMGERSYSTRLAQAFLEGYQTQSPDDTVETLDLWSADVPAFDRTAADGKYKVMGGKDHSAAEADAWARVVATAEQFKAADKYVVSCPMWNFGIPYRLKQYFDVIIQPGLTFSYSPESGYTGLVSGRPLQLLLARGGAYEPGAPASAMDHQTPYLKTIFGFMGFADIRVLAVEPTMAPDAKDRLAELTAMAEKLGREFT